MANTIKVTAADRTLYHVAAAHLGDAAQWWRIVQLNGLTDPDLSAFATPVPLVIPASSGVVHTLAYKDNGPDAPLVMGASGLRFSRDYQIAKGIIVHVTSWDSRQRSRVEYYWSAEGGSTKKALANGNLHSFTLPGARLEQVQSFATRLRSRHYCSSTNIPTTESPTTQSRPHCREAFAQAISSMMPDAIKQACSHSDGLAAGDLNPLCIDPAIALGQQRGDHRADIVRHARTPKCGCFRDVPSHVRIVPHDTA